MTEASRFRVETIDGEHVVYEVREVQLARFAVLSDVDLFLKAKRNGDADDRLVQTGIDFGTLPPLDGPLINVRGAGGVSISGASDEAPETDTSPVDDVPAVARVDQAARPPAPAPAPIAPPVEGRVVLDAPAEDRDADEDDGAGKPEAHRFTGAQIAEAKVRAASGEKVTAIAKEWGKSWTHLRSALARAAAEDKSYPREKRCGRAGCGAGFTADGPLDLYCDACTMERLGASV